MDNNNPAPDLAYDVIQAKMYTLFATKMSDIPEDLRHLLNFLRVTFIASGHSRDLTPSQLIESVQSQFKRDFPDLPDNFCDPKEWIYWHMIRMDNEWVWKKVVPVEGGEVPKNRYIMAGGATRELILISPKAGPLPSLECATAVFHNITTRYRSFFNPPPDCAAVAAKYMELAELEWEVKGENPVLKYGEHTAFFRSPDDRSEARNDNDPDLQAFVLEEPTE